MSKKKVLFISPTPTHPANAGNRLHIKSLVTFFKEQNWDVHFLYLAIEDYDKDAMFSFFNGKLNIITRDIIFQKQKTFGYLKKKFNQITNRCLRKAQQKTGIITISQYLHNSEVDSHFSVYISGIIKKLQSTHNFNVVICEYVFISKSLKYFNQSVFKIIDTHDRFTDRFQTYLNTKLKPGWLSLYKDQEKKALKRADLILATHKNDADYFSNLSGKKNIIFNYIPEITTLPKKLFEKKLLYIASDNEINKATIESFITTTFSLILKSHPDTQLLIGGKICKKLSTKNAKVILIGEVENIKNFYSLGDIVINPEMNGTGYKVKTLEALSFGMPVVATTAGAAGAIQPFSNHLFIADTPEEFTKAVNDLFCNNEVLLQTSINAHKWVNGYKERIANTLIKELPQ